MENRNFGARVARLRADRNVSARDMSLTLGVSESYMHERGSNVPCVPEIFKYFFED